jgi:DNA-binding NarL/FixJ family response regulator
VVVDEEAMVRQMIGRLLEEDHGRLPVAEGASLREAEAALVREKPDLVIIDWSLPDGKGFDLVRRIRVQQPQLRWLLTSRYVQAHPIREAHKLRIHGFVMKASELSVFREGVRCVLSGKSYYCAKSTELLDALDDDDARLTEMERLCLCAFARGENPKMIAARLGRTAKTVRNQLAQVKEKLGLAEPGHLVLYAIQQGLIPMPVLRRGRKAP